jgi:CheY-like chemotaxis protein
MKLQVNMDGVEVLRRIKKCHPAAAVVVITGYIEEKMEQEARDLGIEGYIEKPFTPTQLLTAIETIVKRKKR